MNANSIPAFPVFLRALVPTSDGVAIFMGNEAKIFVIHVDGHSGTAINMAVNGKRAKRPPTHDLLEWVLSGLDVSLERVLIYKVEEGVYYARMTLVMKNELGTKIIEVDARPSDALVLAIRTKRPVFVSKEVLDKVEDMSETLGNILKAQSNKKQ
jgi:bifunctional DNase/RNase